MISFYCDPLSVALPLPTQEFVIKAFVKKRRGRGKKKRSNTPLQYTSSWQPPAATLCSTVRKVCANTAKFHRVSGVFADCVVSSGEDRTLNIYIPIYIYTLQIGECANRTSVVPVSRNSRLCTLTLEDLHNFNIQNATSRYQKNYNQKFPLER